jgi:hypothetical protein
VTVSGNAVEATRKPSAPPVDTATWLAEVREGLRAGKLAPYLGPGVIELAPERVPTTQEAVANRLGLKVALPRRARGNLGAAAQYIETQKHRSVVVQLMAEVFATPVAPLAFHRFLAELPLRLIVDTWYDGAMRAALAGRSDWGEIQGIRRSGLGGDHYYSAYDASGAPKPIAEARGWKTVLYKPHGAITPVKNFLVSDSDYVEVLTEIDIQIPIPEVVQERRSDLGFVFIGCRLNDQTLRAYARQVLKRAGKRHFIVMDPGVMSRNEQRFIDEYGLNLCVCPVRDVLGGLTQS